jgi:hypothetical protein
VGGAAGAPRLAWLDAEWVRTDDWLDACEAERLG